MQILSPLSHTVLVTGVSRPLGLGFAVARQLAEKNYHVILAARDKTQADKLAAELREAGLSASALRLNLVDRSSICDATKRLDGMIEHLDVLVNNASAMPDFGTRPALDVDFDALHSLFEVNVFGCWALTQALLPLLGPVLGGVLGDYWLRLPFIAAAVLNAGNLLMALFVLPESRMPDREKIDLAALNPLRPLRQSLAQAFLPGPAVRLLGERGAVLAGITGACVALAVMAFATQGWLVFAVMPVVALAGIGTPALQSLATRVVDESRQGQFQGVLASAMSLASVVGPLAFPKFLLRRSGSMAGSNLAIGACRQCHRGASDVPSQVSTCDCRCCSASLKPARCRTPERPLCARSTARGSVPAGRFGSGATDAVRPGTAIGRRSRPSAPMSAVHVMTDIRTRTVKRSNRQKRGRAPTVQFLPALQLVCERGRKPVTNVCDSTVSFMPRYISVSIAPGRIALTRTPCGPYSAASTCGSPIGPALLAAQAAVPGKAMH